MFRYDIKLSWSYDKEAWIQIDIHPYKLSGLYAWNELIKIFKED